MAILEAIHHDVYPFIDPRKDLKGSMDGKIVLVIGGSTGIGKTTAQSFALAGAKTVIITARRQNILDEAVEALKKLVPSCEAIGYATDASNPKAVDELFTKLSETGVPDVIVNNAAVGYAGTIPDSDPEKWWLDYEVNVKGVYLCSRAYIRALAGKPGVIINTSSIGSRIVTPGMSSYQTGKQAVNRITEFVDAESSAQGVTAIAYHPGGVLDTTLGRTAPDSIRAFLVDSAELSGGTCVYLATPRAKYLAGRYVEANWDMENLEANKEKVLKEDLLKAKMALL